MKIKVLFALLLLAPLIACSTETNAPIPQVSDGQKWADLVCSLKGSEARNGPPTIDGLRRATSLIKDQWYEQFKGKTRLFFYHAVLNDVSELVGSEHKLRVLATVNAGEGFIELVTADFSASSKAKLLNLNKDDFVSFVGLVDGKSIWGGMLLSGCEMVSSSDFKPTEKALLDKYH